MAIREGAPSYCGVCRSWRPLLATGADASAALEEVARRLARRTPAVEGELGLRLQCMGCALQDEHHQGTLNAETDAMSRLTQGSSVSVCLQHVPRVRPPGKTDSWSRIWPSTRNFVICVSHLT